MNEQALQKKIIKYLEGKGHYVIKTIVTNKRGTPDLVVCSMYDGKFYGIEVKQEGKLKNVTKLQQYHLDLINKTGGKAVVVDSLEAIKEIL